MLKRLRPKLYQNPKGFTLIELMIVIAIIGILAAIAVPQFMAYRIRSYNSAAKAVAHNLKADEGNLNAELGEYGHTEGAGAFLDAATAAIAGVNDDSNANTGDITLRVAATASTAATPVSGARLAGFHSISGKMLAIPIAIGDNMNAFCSNANANPDSFVAIARHFNGDTAYAIDIDVENVLYTVSNPDWAGNPAGGQLYAAPPGVTVGVDDFWDGTTVGGTVNGNGAPTANWLPAS